LHYYPQLAELVKSFRPDIIDLWEEPWGLVSAHACRVRNRLAPNALILSETEQNIEKKLPPPFEQFRSYTLANADWAIGRSNEAVSVLRAKGYKGPASVVPNAVDVRLFRPMDKRECRSRLNLSGFVVGYIGRLVSEKGVEDLVSMLDRCPADVSLVFAGAGPMLPNLKRAVQNSGKADRVRFLGNVDPRDLPVVMNSLDLMALPSRSTQSWKEQFGRVIIEAQACGIPVVGSNSGAIPEVVGDGGRIVPERSPGALAEVICALRADPRLMRDLGAAGLASAHANYTWEMVAKKMADTYERMLAHDSASGSSSVAASTSTAGADNRSLPEPANLGVSKSSGQPAAIASSLR
jgi:glycosyltransferase involved in cell wall biosynthesis